MALGHIVTKVGKLGAIYTIGSFLPQIVGMLLLPIFTRYLPPAQMGIVQLAMQIQGTLFVFMQLGLWNSLKSHYFRVPEADRPRLVRTVLIGMAAQLVVMCLALSLGGYYLAELLLPNLPLDRGLVLLLWLMVVWSCPFLAIQRLAWGLAQLHEKAVTSVGIDMLKFFTQTGLGLFAVVVLGWQAMGRFGGVFGGILLGGVVGFVYLLRNSGGSFDWTLYRRTLRTGLTFVPHALSCVLAVSANAWLINKLVDSRALGIFGVAMLFPSMLELPLFALGSAFYPTLAKMMADGGEQSRRDQSRLYTLILTGVVAMSLAVSLFAPIGIFILTAPEYHSAAVIVPILVVAWLFQGFYLIASQPVFYAGGGLWMALATGLSVVTLVACSFLFIPWLGIAGAALSLIGCFVVRMAVISVISQKLYPLPWQVFTLAKVIAMGAVLGAADYLICRNMGIALSIAVKMVLLLAMVPAAWAAGVVNADELAWGWNLVVSKVRSIFRRSA